jgi:50S ribosomal protein L16 3-hydroxylase
VAEVARAPLGGLSPWKFLREYWQRKPLLARAALPGLGELLSADELAGLALEEEVESRIVLERGATPWELRRGPFTARDFAALPASRWTLLVQAVDQWWPAARAVRERFDFMPGWRFDDVMVSYATDRGGVGPHFDYYDVFLVQASGRRRWRIGAHCDAHSPLRTDTELRILRRFETREEWVVEPGDVLYIPPGIAHWGIAEGECMTWSVGFRAPAHAEILQEVAARAAQTCPEHLRFADAGVRYPRDGRIPGAAITQLQAVLREVAEDRALLADWFARFMTERKYPELGIAPARRAAGDPRDWLRGGARLERHPASRFAWVAGRSPMLYIDGLAFACDAALARLLCGNAALDAAALLPRLRSRAARDLLTTLLAQGVLYRAA